MSNYLDAEFIDDIRKRVDEQAEQIAQTIGWDTASGADWPPAIANIRAQLQHLATLTAAAKTVLATPDLHYVQCPLANTPHSSPNVACDCDGLVELARAVEAVSP